MGSSANLWYAYYVTRFDNMGTFHILTDVIFVRSEIYQLKSTLRKNVFSYSKTDPVPVCLESEIQICTFYLVTLSEKIVVKKWGTKEHILDSQKIIICGIEKCEYSIDF